LNAIRYSREEIARKVLPAWAQPYRAIDKAVILSLESLERDLVAISKTETTSSKTETVERCNCMHGGYEKLPVVTVAVRRVVEHADKPYYMAQSMPLNYCPNCGRKLN